MSKIICDVCGTSYPETAAQCPICGCARSTDANVISGNALDPELQDAGAYTYVKGGRFSKRNVRKRAWDDPDDMPADNSPSEDYGEEEKSSKGLTVVVIVLILAILAVVAYILFNFIGYELFGKDETSASTQSTVQTTTESTAPTELKKPCEDIQLTLTDYKLTAVGESVTLQYVITPSETTDTVLFSSADTAVATVTADGAVVAAGAGETTITITCGEVKKTVTVTCDIQTTTEPPTEATTEPVTEPTTKPVIEFELNRDDFTLAYVGDSWQVYSGIIPKSEINWRSDNESVVTVHEGKVVAVGPGHTVIYGEYEGVERSCIVHCSFSATGSGEESGYIISHSDVTLPVDDWFTLVLRNSDEEPISVEWQSKNGKCSISGNRITRTESGYDEIYAVYKDVTYTCIVR